MAARPALVAASIAGALALGTAGYFANEWRVCRALENDYISAIEDYTANSKARALMGAVGVDLDDSLEQRNELQARSLELQKILLTRIYDRCGMDAGKAAGRRAGEVLGKGIEDVLSIP